MINIAIGLFSGILLFIILRIILGWSVTALIFPSMVLTIVLIILLSRKTFKRLEEIMNRSVKEVEAGRFDNAIRLLKEGYRFKNRGFFVEGQINSQIGIIYYIKKDFDKGFEYLKKSFSRNWVSMGMLACCYYRKNEYDKMVETLEKSAKLNKKEPMVWALYSYLINKIGKRDEAMAVLNRGLKYLPNDKRLKANLLSIQNKKPMKMRAFGDQWIQFHLEKIPMKYVSSKRGYYR